MWKGLLMSKEELPHAPSFEESSKLIHDNSKANNWSSKEIVEAWHVVNAQTLNRIATALEALLAKIDTLV